MTLTLILPCRSGQVFESDVYLQENHNLLILLLVLKLLRYSAVVKQHVLYI